jgi:hypothetical protein
VLRTRFSIRGEGGDEMGVACGMHRRDMLVGRVYLEDQCVDGIY